MKHRCLCFAALALAAATTSAAVEQQQLKQQPATAAAIIEAAVSDSPDLYSKFDFTAKRWPGGVPPLRDEPPENAFANVQYAKDPPAVKARGVGRHSVDEGDDEVAQAESNVGGVDGESLSEEEGRKFVTAMTTNEKKKNDKAKGSLRLVFSLVS